MGAEFKQVDPQFIMVQYDIPQGTPQGGELRAELKANGAAMVTMSVYMVRYTPELYERIQGICAKHPRIRCYITTPEYPVDQAAMVRQQYEEGFRADFHEAKKKLMWCDQALAGEILWTDKEGKKPDRPFKANEIMQRIKTVENLIRNMEKSLAARKKNEPDTNFDELEAEIRHDNSYLNTLYRACNTYKNRGINPAMKLDGAGAE